MKSLMARVYDDVAVRSTAGPVHAPVAVCRFTVSTRLPTAAATSYVKQRPETCGNRPFAPGIAETPFSRNDLSSAPLTLTVFTTFPNGSTAFTWPRVIGNGGGVKAGQKSVGLSTVGQVSESRSPPEFVIAKSVTYVRRIAAVTVLPTRDSQSRPSARPHESALGIATAAVPIWTCM